jgi:hypothetical protein
MGGLVPKGRGRSARPLQGGLSLPTCLTSEQQEQLRDQVAQGRFHTGCTAMGGGRLWDSIQTGRDVLPADPPEGAKESPPTSGYQRFSGSPRGMEKGGLTIALTGAGTSPEGPGH